MREEKLTLYVPEEWADEPESDTHIPFARIFAVIIFVYMTMLVLRILFDSEFSDEVVAIEDVLVSTI